MAQNIDTTLTNEWVSKAQAAMNRGDNRSAIDTLQLAAELLEGGPFREKLIQVYETLSQVHANNGSFIDAAVAIALSIPIIEKLNNPNRLANSYELQAFYLFRAESYKDAISTGKKVLSILEDAPDSTILIRIYSTISSCYSYQADWNNSLQYSYKCLEIAQSLRDSSYIGSSYSHIGRVYKFQNEYAESETYQKKALEIYKLTKDTVGTMVALNDLGILYKQTERYRESTTSYQEALSLSQELGMVSVYETFFINLANLSAKMEAFQQAESYLNKLNIDSLYRRESLVEVYRIRAEIALSKSQYQTALKEIQTAHELALKNDFFNELPEISAIWAEVYEQQGDYSNALSTYKLYTTYKDSMINADKNKSIEELRTQYETAEKEKKLQEQEAQIQLLDREKELSNLRFRISVIVAIFLILIILGTVYLWRKRNQLNQAQLEAEQIRLEAEQVRLSERNRTLEEVGQLKSRFFSNISHELRTPITLISTPVQHVLEKFSSKLPSEVKHPLTLVQQNAHKLLVLVSELLELSRLEAGKVEIKEQATNIHSFCKQIFSLHDSHAQRKNISYQFDSHIDDTFLVTVDRNRLEKIINNLLSNALKYTGDGGKVALHIETDYETSFINSTINHDSNDESSPINFHLSVSDTGRGIPSEDIPYIFDRYFQSKRKDIPLEGGTGIGLALAKELANVLGGNLTVSSKWEQGSTFQLSLPLKLSHQPIQEEIPTYHSQSNAQVSVSPTQEGSAILIDTPTILIVEDNLDVQEMLRQLLQGEYNCVFANNGKEALAHLNSGIKVSNQVLSPSLILSDLMMPTMDGHELMENIKADERWKKIPTIMLTAMAAQESKLKALRLGVDDYLLKPFSPSELKARISNLISNFENRQAFIEENSNELDFTFEETPSAEDLWLAELEENVKEAMNKQLDISADYLADAMALSRRQLLRRIKASTGLSIKQYMQEIKLQKARHLLENKHYQTIAEVGYACGFNTPGYFSKVYENRFGKRPGEY